LDDQSPAAIIGTSPMHSYNYVLLKDRITYNDDNFHHLFYFGDQPWVYITRPDSSIKNIQDIYTKLPESKKPFIGSSGSNTLMNIMSLNHSKNIKLTPVEYKSPQDIVLGVLRNEIDVGIVSLGGSSALELVRNGDLKILGSTFSDYVSIQNIKVPSVSKQTGAVQFSGFTTLSTNKKGSTQFAKDLFRAVSSQEMIDFLGQNLIFHTRYDYTKTKELIQEKRELIEKRSTWLVTQ
jgi:tripartite-type tricarboxylate transporter receptor subunit TctC